VIDYRHTEEASGFQDEHTHETIVAFDRQRFVIVRAHEFKDFAPRGRGREFSAMPQEITQAEYEKLADGHERSDSPDALQVIENRKAAEKRRAQASAELKMKAPKCPKCGGTLTTRKDPRGHFWGCRSYPKCKGTAQFTSEHSRLYEIASRFE